MRRLEAISVLIGGNRAVDLAVEEFHPYDPAAYVVDPGWTAYDSNGVEYFVSVSGDVFRQPENESVGVALAKQIEQGVYFAAEDGTRYSR